MSERPQHLNSYSAVRKHVERLFCDLLAAKRQLIEADERVRMIEADLSNITRIGGAGGGGY